MSVTQPLGFRAAGSTAGLKPSGKPDLCLIVRDTPTDLARTGSASCFTRNAVVGAPVIIGKHQRERALSGGPPARAVLVNAGNSNAATGEQGVINARRCMSEVARLLNLSPEEILPSSTGIIGRPLAVDKITAALPGLVAQLARGERADAQAAGAIMTTDLVPKHASRTVTIGGHAVTLGAIAKGSGMIAPRMDFGHASPRTPPSATMLAFVTTDCAISSADLQEALDQASAGSFNSISVDNHASCSDTVIALASGASAAPVVTRDTPAFRAFTEALADLCQDVSEQIVTDGEGATRIFRVTVKGTDTDEGARVVAREIVNSPLVKCAIHGQDPNWGRIVTAAGNAGVPFDTQQASLLIGPVQVYRAGVPVVEALSDPRLKQAMSAKRVEILLTLGLGPGEGAMIGCDLSKEYVSINADYTT